MFKGVVLVDIDGPLAAKNMPCLYRLYNEYFQLALSDSQLATLTSFSQFEELPVVKEFRTYVGEEKYHYLLQLLCYEPRHVRQARVVSGACAGTERLLRQSTLFGYCTARSMEFHRPWNKAIQQATRQWLAASGFPNVDAVFYADNPRGKILWLLECLREDPQPVVLIDDLYQDLLEAYRLLEKDQQLFLQKWLVLGAYKAVDAVDSNLRVLPLPKWKHIDQFLELL